MSQAMNISKDDKGNYLWTPNPARRFKTQAEAESYGEAMVATRTKRAGGQLSSHELKFGVHELTFAQNAALANFVPAKPPAGRPLTEVEQTIKSARKTIEEEKYAAMTPGERTLHNALKRQSDEIELAERKAEHENSPITAGNLAALDAVIEEIKFDRSRSTDELFHAMKARKQAESFEGDAVATAKIVRSVFANEEIRRERLVADANVRRQALEAELASLARPVSNRVPVTGATLSERALSLEAGMDNDPTHGSETMTRLILAKAALRRGEGEPMQALLDEFAAAPVPPVEVAANE